MLGSDSMQHSIQIVAVRLRSWQVPRATLFSTLEKTVATSRVMYDTKHRFMPEDTYVKHVTEVLLEGEGRLTKAQATLQW